MHTLLWFTSLLRTTSCLLLTNRLHKQLGRWRQEEKSGAAGVYISSFPQSTHSRDAPWAASAFFVQAGVRAVLTLKRLHLSQRTTSRKHISKCLDCKAQSQWAVSIPVSRLLAKSLIKYKLVKDNNVKFRFGENQNRVKKFMIVS